MTDCVNSVKEWTGRARATIVYDGMVDEFTCDGLFIKVKDGENITIVWFTTDGDVFGGFYNVAVIEEEHFNDPNLFSFSFESHGRCATPQRFALRPFCGPVCRSLIVASRWCFGMEIWVRRNVKFNTPLFRVRNIRKFFGALEGWCHGDKVSSIRAMLGIAKDTWRSYKTAIQNVVDLSIKMLEEEPDRKCGGWGIVVNELY